MRNEKRGVMGEVKRDVKSLLHNQVQTKFKI